MDKAEHAKLHRQLRREGECNVPQPILKTISHSAFLRREGPKLHRRDYMLTYMRNYYENHREVWNRYQRDYQRTYRGASKTERNQHERFYKHRMKIFAIRPDIIAAVL